MLLKSGFHRILTGFRLRRLQNAYVEYLRFVPKLLENIEFIPHEQGSMKVTVGEPNRTRTLLEVVNKVARFLRASDEGCAALLPGLSFSECLFEGCSSLPAYPLFTTGFEGAASANSRLNRPFLELNRLPKEDEMMAGNIAESERRKGKHLI